MHYVFKYKCMVPLYLTIPTKYLTLTISYIKYDILCIMKNVCYPIFIYCNEKWVTSLFCRNYISIRKYLCMGTYYK